nr:hypothetical protein orf100 [Schizostauron trachyderma]UDP55620.1 hypothetical protein orf100 [Schizostauron trachyderma]
MSINYYRNNDLLSACCNSICQLRGDEDYVKMPYSEIKDSSSTSKSSKHIDNILNDDRVYERINKSTDKIATKEFLNASYIQFQESHPYRNLGPERNLTVF